VQAGVRRPLVVVAAGKSQRDKPQANVVVPRAGRDADQFGRRRLEHGQVRQ